MLIQKGWPNSFMPMHALSYISNAKRVVQNSNHIFGETSLSDLCISSQFASADLSFIACNSPSLVPPVRSSSSWSSGLSADPTSFNGGFAVIVSSRPVDGVDRDPSAGEFVPIEPGDCVEAGMWAVLLWGIAAGDAVESVVPGLLEAAVAV